MTDQPGGPSVSAENAAIIIVPTYNERENVPELISEIRSFCKQPGLDILVVDSASPDGTADVVRNLQQTDPQLFLLEQTAKLGLGRAYLDGMRWALDLNKYRHVITMDADFSHHPRHLATLLARIEQGYDLVIGSRYVEGGRLENWPISRQALSRFANWYAKTLTGLPFHDLTAGFHCFESGLLEEIIRGPIHTDGYAFLIELKMQARLKGARYSEVPIVFADRTKGESKISRRVMFESMLFVVRQFPLRRQIRRTSRFRLVEPAALTARN